MSIRIRLAKANAINLNQRDHHHVRAVKTKHLRALGRLVALDDKGQYERAHLTVRIGWPDRRRRDAHNLMPTLKALIDGMVDAGLLPDDDDKHLTGPDLRPYFAGETGSVVLDFEFAPIAAEVAS